MLLQRDQLHNYQNRGSGHIKDNLSTGLFMGMGLGKTVTTLTAIQDLIYYELDITYVLVIATKKIVESVWKEECEAWEHLKHMTISKIVGTPKQRIRALNVKADIHLISRDNVHWLCEFFNYKLPYDMLVVDESSSFKNNSSKRFKALRKVAPKFRRKVILTGTPAPNGLMDLWSQVYLLDAGERLEKFKTHFTDIYFRPDKKNGNVVFSYKLRKGADTVIHNKVSDICLSMNKEDYLDLPDRIDRHVYLELGSTLKDKYDSFAKEQVLMLLESGEEITAMNAAGLTIKLQQFTSGAIYDEDKDVHHIHDIKLDYLEEIVEAAAFTEEQVLIAWNFQHERDRILARLKTYGAKEIKTPQDVKDWNDKKIPIGLLHPMSGGHGLNLQKGGAHIVFWFSMTWNLELYQQFNARLDRQGNPHAVMVYHPMIKETIDIKIYNSLCGKYDTQESLMQAVKDLVDRYGNN